MPTSPVKTRIPLSSFGHLITEVKVWTEINLCMSSCRDAIIDTLIKKRRPIHIWITPLPTVMQHVIPAAEYYALATWNNWVTIQMNQNTWAGILDEENVSSAIAIYHEQWLFCFFNRSYISRFKMYVFRSPLITHVFAAALFRQAFFFVPVLLKVESDHCTKLLQHTLKVLNGEKAWTQVATL